MFETVCEWFWWYFRLRMAEYLFLGMCVCMGFTGSSAGKESAFNAGDPGLIPGLGRSPGGGNGNPLEYSGLENPHRQRNLAGYSPWGHKESDTTEWLSTAQHMCICIYVLCMYCLQQGKGTHNSTTKGTYSGFCSVIVSPCPFPLLDSPKMKVLRTSGVMLPKAHLTSHSRMSGSR